MSYGKNRIVGGQQLTVSLEESMTGGGFASGALPDSPELEVEVSAAHGWDEQDSPEDVEAMMFHATLTDPATDLAGLVMGLDAESLVTLAADPDIAGANARIVAVLVRRELLRRLGRMTAA